MGFSSRQTLLEVLDDDQDAIEKLHLRDIAEMTQYLNDEGIEYIESKLLESNIDQDRIDNLYFIFHIDLEKVDDRYELSGELNLEEVVNDEENKTLSTINPVEKYEITDVLEAYVLIDDLVENFAKQIVRLFTATPDQIFKF